MQHRQHDVWQGVLDGEVSGTPGAGTGWSWSLCYCSLLHSLRVLVAPVLAIQAMLLTARHNNLSRHASLMLSVCVRLLMAGPIVLGCSTGCTWVLLGCLWYARDIVCCARQLQGHALPPGRRPSTWGLFFQCVDMVQALVEYVYTASYGSGREGEGVGG